MTKRMNIFRLGAEKYWMGMDSQHNKTINKVILFITHKGRTDNQFGLRPDRFWVERAMGKRLKSDQTLQGGRVKNAP